MRLALFFTYDISLVTWARTGLIQREIALYEALVRNGIDVTFITYGDMSDRALSNELGGINVCCVYERKVRPRYKYVRYFYSLLIGWVFHNEIERVDVIKTNQVWGGWSAVISKWLLRKPLIVRGGYEPYTFIKLSQSSLFKQTVYKLICRFIYSNADFIQMATQADAATVNEIFGVEMNRIRVAPNWVDTELFYPFEKPNLISNTVLVVGRLDWQKNIELVLYALQGTGIKLDVIGSGNEETSLRILAKELAVETRFLGKVDNNALPTYYNRYPVYVLCSRFEGNPKTLLEAMSCGCSTVATNVVGINSIVQHGVNGLLCQADKDSVRSSILQLLASPEKRKIIGQQARISILKEYSFQKQLQDEIAFISEATVNYRS